MTIIHLLVVVGLVQSVFLGGIVLLLIANRRRSARQGRASAAVAAQLAVPVQAWLVGEGSVDDVARILAQLSVDLALEQAIVIATSRAASTQRDAFAAAIQDARWVEAVLARATSRRWWRRLDAARLLAVVAAPRHRDLLRRLLDDPHPAVQGLAAASIPRVADFDAVARLLDRLPERSAVVRLYQFSMLKECWWLATPALLARLTPDAPVPLLETWINLAETIATSDVLERVWMLRAHPDALVRLAVARALKRYFHPAAEAALLVFLSDDDWRVRALAARSLGTLGDAAAAPRLAALLEDRHWWVRFRSGLALAQLGEEGRRALRHARGSGDRYAAEMAAMVSGLSPGSVTELSEA